MRSYILDTAAVVYNDNFKGGVFAAVPAAQEIPSDSSKSIDGHLKLCFSSQANSA